MTTLVGRQREADRLRQSMRSMSDGPRIVLIRGAAGIGKTALWRWALAQHTAAGHRVLVTRPAEDELHGPMTGLLDLFEDADPDPGLLDLDTDVFERGRALLRTLRRIASATPVVLAIDDLQWLDAISVRTLGYALRRLDIEPVIVLATARDPSEVRRATLAAVARQEELVLGPLPLDAIRQVVRSAVGNISRPVLERVHELAGGNPLYAVELARAAGADGLGPAAPPTLRGALAARLGDVPADRLAVLRTLAAAGPTTAGELIGLCAGDDAATTLAVAIEDGVVVAGEDGLVRFDHPLVASVILDGTNPVERSTLHGRLAALVTDPDARARHLALSCTDPDSAAAAELEAAAERAGRRGAATVAAELAAHSVRVTPRADEDALARRALAGITFRAAAGEPERALALTDDLVARLGTGAARVEAITLRVFLDIDHGEAFLTRALDDAGDDVRARGRVLELLGWLLGTYRGEFARARSLGEEALTIARATGDEELEMLAAATLSTSALLAGQPAPDLMRRALDLAVRHDPPRLGRWPQLFRARHCLWGGELDEARRRFEEMQVVFLERGIEFQRPYRLNDLAWVEVAAGHLDVAVELTDDGLAAALDAANPQATAWHSYPAGLAFAHSGRHADAIDAATNLHRWGAEQPPRALMAMHLRGLVALSRGDAVSALAELAPAVELADRFGYRHPGYVPILPDAIEASALAGDVATCERLAADLDSQAVALGLPWVDAAQRRCVGLVALAAGCPDAPDALAEAAVAFERLGYRLDAARTLLLRGRALRRAGQRAAATATLEDAGQRFVAMGAHPWADQAVAELARVTPGRPSGELTPTESRVADLVVRGRRNREIAAELFISVATVEAHLTRMYRKLGVRSRTELAGRMHRRAG